MPVLDQKEYFGSTETVIGDKYIVLLASEIHSHNTVQFVYIWDLAGQDAGRKFSTDMVFLHIESMRGEWLVLCQNYGKPKSTAYIYDLREPTAPISIKEECHIYEVVYRNDTEPAVYGITIEELHRSKPNSVFKH
ncbi:hypothetical protein THASP1DRAFT_29974 [Thamnocephalis sphaerospora]|uniref:Uncharacterized protein n=1 Tax=Thamnocephalis sphaerospora TaxID=78915 RepID=A0A4P9XS86_9FUNG|nr:hypothetical protein THASP1DRAFT_29974 [Thamnocephalis sphaerospora]|eukprot:RKP08210.1 hypothetical protein THASP1DRAFT_29974 [Thamnocephalis sphaerospora]